MDKRYQIIQRDSIKLLHKAQLYHHISLGFKITIIILSLTSSYLSAISDIYETIKTYFIASFSLTTAILSGITSIKKLFKRICKII